MSQQTNSIVEITDEKLSIENAEIDDKDVVEYFSEKEEGSAEELLRLSVKVGVSTLRLSETSEDVEYIRHEFEKINRDLQGEIDDLRDELEDWFDQDDGEFSELLEETFGKDGEIVEEVFDHTRDGTPIARLYSDIQDELQELRDKFIEQETRQEVEEKTTIKGKNFEDDLEEILPDIVRKSDEIRRTGDEHGELDDRFVGDFVVTIGETQQNIVIEAKNVSQITKPKLKEELKEGMENRNADYGILVLRDEDAASDFLGAFREFGQEMLYIAISDEDTDEYDLRLLELAYEWARMRTISEQLDVTDEVDPERIQTLVDEAESEIDKFRNIRTQCSNIESARRNIEQELDEIQDEVEERLDKINSEISTASVAE